MIGYTMPHHDIRDRVNQIFVDREEAGMTFKDIAKKHGISSVRVSQIYHHELSKRLRYKDLPEDITEALIDHLPLSTRLSHCLINSFPFNVKVKDVVGTPRNILLRIPNFGIVSLNEWNTFCLKHGLELSK